MNVVSRTDRVPVAYKLLHLRKNGTLGPLFINRKQIIPVGVWLDAESHRTKGYAYRPGWHAAQNPDAPHLSMRDRVWCAVELEDATLLLRPAAQGGAWWLANRMRVITPMFHVPECIPGMDGAL